MANKSFIVLGRELTGELKRDTITDSSVYPQ